MNKSVVLIFSVLLLSGCTWGVKDKDVVVSTEHLNTCTTPPKASQIVMRTPTFYVVRDKHGVIWVALRPSGYQKMSENTSEILAHLRQKNAIIKYYKDCNKNDKDSK